METFTWRVSLRGGKLGEEASFTTDRETAVMLRDLWSRIERCPPGGKRSGLVCELRTLMDLKTLFPSGRFLAPESRFAASPSPPPYLGPGSPEEDPEARQEGDVQEALPVPLPDPAGRRRKRSLTPA